MAHRRTAACFLCGRTKENCRENGITGDFALFGLPKLNSEVNTVRRQLWLSSIKQFMPIGWVIPTTEFKVCSAHFKDEDTYLGSSDQRLYLIMESNTIVKPEIYMPPVAITESRQPLALVSSKNIHGTGVLDYNRKRPSSTPKQKAAKKSLFVPPPSQLDKTAEPSANIRIGVSGTSQHNSNSSSTAPLLVPTTATAHTSDAYSDQPNTLTALSLRESLLNARSVIDYRNVVHSVTPAREYLVSTLIQKENILLSWANNNDDNALVDNVIFFIFNEVCKIRKTIEEIEAKNRKIEAKNRKLSEKDKIISDYEKKSEAVNKLQRESKSKISKLESELKNTKKEVISVGSKLEKQEMSNNKLKRTLKNLRAQCKRRNITIDQMQAELHELEKHDVLSKEIVATLENYVTPSALAFMKRLVDHNLVQNCGLKRKSEDFCAFNSSLLDGEEANSALLDDEINDGKRKISRVKYDKDLRSFALTLNFYSPLAYDYVRETFNNALPSQRTIRGWLKEIDCEPGITLEALSAISARAKTAKANKEEIFLAMAVDEMAIRQNTDFNGEDSVKGYVNTGDIKFDNVDYGKYAVKAFAFMAVCIDKRWKIPFGYFLINSLNAKQMAALVEKGIKELEEVGAKVISLTFDGTTTNISMANELGCDLDNRRSPVCFFPNPFDNSRNVYVFLDTCHMIKLTRNLFGDGRIFYNKEADCIDWFYLEELEKLQSDDGLRAACKLTKKNVKDWRRHKMNVRVAVQTLSKSVADALEYCMTVLKLPSFGGAAATIEFIRIFDELFDRLNSTNPNSLRFKAPLSLHNRNECMTFFEYATDYILNLKIHKLPCKDYPIGTLAIDTNRYTGLFGMIVCMKSITNIFELLVMPKIQADGTKKAHLKYLLAHRFSQDHLEMFFGAIRRRGGWNNNPSCKCFEGAYKRLIILNEIKASNNGNAIAIDDIKILSVTEKKKQKEPLDFQTNLISYDEEFLSLKKLIHIDEERGSYYVDLLMNTVPFEHNYEKGKKYNHVRIPELSVYAQGVVEYIAGWAVRIIKKIIQCKECQSALEDPTQDCKLIRIKNIGSLCVPSADVQKICKKTETCYREVQKIGLNSILKRQIPIRITKFFIGENIFQSLTDHVRDQDVLEGHIGQLVTAISKTYLHCRIFNATRDINRGVDSVRHFYTKLILFSNK